MYRPPGSLKLLLLLFLPVHSSKRPGILTFDTDKLNLSGFFYTQTTGNTIPTRGHTEPTTAILFAGTHYWGMQVLQLLKEALRYEVQTTYTSCDQSEALKDRECAGLQLLQQPYACPHSVCFKSGSVLSQKLVLYTADHKTPVCSNCCKANVTGAMTGTTIYRRTNSVLLI